MKNLKLTDQSKGILAIVTAASLYALMGVGIRLLDAAEIPDMMQVALRVSLGMIAAFIIFNKDIKLKNLKQIPIKDWLVMFLMSTVGYAIAVYFITRAFIETTFLNAALIYNTLPIFIYIYALIFGKAKFRVSTLLLTVLAMYGVSIISANSFVPVVTGFGSGEFFALLAASTFAVFYIGRQLLSNKVNNAEITFYTMVMAGISAFIISILLGESINLNQLFGWEVILGLAIGIFVNVATTYLTNYGFGKLNAVLASQLILTEVIFSFIFGLLFYNEPFSAFALIGGVIIIISVLITNKVTESTS